MNKLYAGGPDLRLRQEWILGVGGVRVLRAHGHRPRRVARQRGTRRVHAGGAPARVRGAGACATTRPCREVRARSVFTTHTPVPAGHDAFSVDQLEGVRGPVWEEMGIDRETFFGLGAHPDLPGPVPHDRHGHAALRPA